MDHRFTFSIFTIEINGRPTLALQAKRHKDAERLCEHGQLRTVEYNHLSWHRAVRCQRHHEDQVQLLTSIRGSGLITQRLRATEM